MKFIFGNLPVSLVGIVNLWSYGAVTHYDFSHFIARANRDLVLQALSCSIYDEKYN